MDRNETGPGRGGKRGEQLTEIEATRKMLKAVRRMEYPPLSTVDEPQCDHASVTISKATKQVTCRKCRWTIDPFEALVALTEEWNRTAQTMIDLGVKDLLEKRVREELERLDREGPGSPGRERG